MNEEEEQARVRSIIDADTAAKQEVVSRFVKRTELHQALIGMPSVPIEQWKLMLENSLLIYKQEFNAASAVHNKKMSDLLGEERAREHFEKPVEFDRGMVDKFMAI